MIEKISIRLSEQWGELLGVDKEEIECYRYGLELLISTFINTCIIILISILFRKPLLFLPYMFVYVPMRMFAGGYHASNHFRCIMFSSVSFGACIILNNYLYDFWGTYIWLVTMSISFGITYKIVPVCSENKPLTTNQINKVRRNVAIIEVVLLLLWIFLIYSNLFNEYTAMFFCAEVAVVITILLGERKSCRS